MDLASLMLKASDPQERSFTLKALEALDPGCIWNWLDAMDLSPFTMNWLEAEEPSLTINLLEPADLSLTMN